VNERFYINQLMHNITKQTAAFTLSADFGFAFVVINNYYNPESLRLPFFLRILHFRRAVGRFLPQEFFVKRDVQGLLSVLMDYESLLSIC